MTTPKPKDFQLEKALNELEKLISKMESGKLSLENSLAHFEQGVNLIQHCQQALTKAEQKIQILMKKHGNKAELHDFDDA